MIAKGLDFPNVTLVGVIDADSMLNQPDLRAAERTFQLISQVAGRTGRSARGGRVFVQTASPTEPAIRKAAEHDYAGFAAVELAHRLSRGVPPFRRMIRIILRGPEKSALNDYAKKVSGSLREAIGSETGGVRILGPAPAPIAKLKGLFRIHFQLFAEDPTALQRIWHATAAVLPAAGQVEIAVDVDPLNLR